MVGSNHTVWCAISILVIVYPINYKIYQELKRDGFSVQTKTASFAERAVSLVKKAIAGEPAPTHWTAKDRYANWVILAVQGFKEYFRHDYRKLMDVLREIPRVTKSLNLTGETLPHFSTVCARKQAIPMKRWRAILNASVKL